MPMGSHKEVHRRVADKGLREEAEDMLAKVKQQVPSRLEKNKQAHPCLVGSFMTKQPAQRRGGQLVSGLRYERKEFCVGSVHGVSFRGFKQAEALRGGP